MGLLQHKTYSILAVYSISLLFFATLHSDAESSWHKQFPWNQGWEPYAVLVTVLKRNDPTYVHSEKLGEENFGLN